MGWVHAFMLSCFSHVQLFVTPWTAAHQAPLSMGFSRQEYWSGLPRPPPGDLPNIGIERTSHVSPVLQVVSVLLSHLRNPWGGQVEGKYPLVRNWGKKRAVSHCNHHLLNSISPCFSKASPFSASGIWAYWIYLFITGFISPGA